MTTTPAVAAAIMPRLIFMLPPKLSPSRTAITTRESQVHSPLVGAARDRKRWVHAVRRAAAAAMRSSEAVRAIRTCRPDAVP